MVDHYPKCMHDSGAAVHPVVIPRVKDCLNCRYGCLLLPLYVIAVIIDKLTRNRYISLDGCEELFPPRPWNINK